MGGALNDKAIGIKLADGSFYPVLEEGYAGRKRLVLTTVRDNQDTVRIDLHRGSGERAEETQYVGSLIIEGIAAAPQREPEIELEVGVDEAGTLEAAAQDARTGEKQTLSVSLESTQAGTPQFELESEGGLGLKAADDLEDSLLTGETYPVGATDRRKEHLHKRKRSPLLLIGFVILSLILIAVIAFLVYRALNGRPIPALLSHAVEGGGAAAPVVAGQKPAGETQPAGETRPAEPAASAAESPPTAAEPRGTAKVAVPPAEEKKTTADGVWYRIRWGDTLWDIAGTYYRNPWLYPKIAKANRIANPDLIFAGRQLFIPEN
jgi:nucleoid-associated protein YgaU